MKPIDAAKARFEARKAALNRNTFGPGGRFEVIVNGDNGMFELLDSGRFVFTTLDRALLFNVASKVLRAEGAPLDVVERTMTGMRFEVMT